MLHRPHGDTRSSRFSRCMWLGWNGLWWARRCGIKRIKINLKWVYLTVVGVAIAKGYTYIKMDYVDGDSWAFSHWLLY